MHRHLLELQYWFSLHFYGSCEHLGLFIKFVMTDYSATATTQEQAYSSQKLGEGHYKYSLQVDKHVHLLSFHFVPYEHSQSNLAY